MDRHWIKDLNGAGNSNWILGLPLPGLEKQASISEIIAFSLSKASFIDDRGGTDCPRQPQPENLPELTELCLGEAHI